MKKVGHILGLVFVLVLMGASQAFLLQYPFMSAGFLLLIASFYAACTVISRQTIFLYPMMIAGALSYFLCLHGLGVHFVWFSVCAILLVFPLGVARRVVESKNKHSYAVAFRNGINITVAFFTFVALYFASTYWSLSTHIYALTFFGYAIFYYVQNYPGQQSKLFNYAWVYFSLAGFVALAKIVSFLPLSGTVIFSALTFVLAFVGTKTHRQQGGGHALPVLSGALISCVISFLYAVHVSHAVAISFFANSIAFWYIYQACGRTVATRRIAGTTEKVFTKFFKAAFLILPVLFWIILLHQRFPFTYLSALLCAAYVFFFARLTRPPYRSFFKNRNHYVYLSGAFFTALYCTILSLFDISAIVYATPAAVCALMGLAYAAKKKEDTVISNSVIDVTLLLTAVTSFLLLTSDSFTPVMGLTFAGIMAVAFIICLVFIKSHTVLYPLSFLVAFGLHCAFQFTQLPTSHAMITYLALSVLFAYLAAALAKKYRGMSNVFLFSLLLFSAAAILATLGNVSLKLVALCVLAAVCVNVGTLLDARKGMALTIASLGHFFALWAVGLLVLNELPGHVPYALLSLAIAYFIAFAGKQKKSLAYPASILASVGYLLLLINICPAAWVMLAYFPLTLAFLFWRARLPLLASVYFSTALVVLWVLDAGYAGYVSVALASAFYAAGYFFIDTKNTVFRTLAIGLMLFALYVLSAAFLSVELSLVLVSAVASVLFVAGTVIGRAGRGTSWHWSLIVAGLAGLFIATGTSVMLEFTYGAKIIIVLSSVACLAASVIFKKDIFLYLLTANLGLLFFNFIQGSGTKFTQDLFSYFLYGIILVGILFAIPHIKRLRRYERVYMMFTIANWKGALVYSLPILALLGLIAMFYSVKITEHPQFCGSCHYMDDYIESWEHSAHKDVRCVDCHYEPGAKAVVKGKVDGFLQLAKYMTHTYSSKPVAEVSDLSCLRSECHAEMDRGISVEFGNNISFPHSKHLDHKVRAHELRCTTCHSKAGAEKHMEVNTSTCFNCHFKGVEVTPSDCRKCHSRLTVSEGGAGFDHTEFFEGTEEVDCNMCHPGIIQGTGEAVPDNCLFCHTRSDVKKEITLEELHYAHTSEHKVECFQCHSDIKHGADALEKQRVPLKSDSGSKASK